MSGLDPSGPAQPTNQQGYETSGNPVQKDPAEQQASSENASANADSAQTDQRIPTSQSTSIDDATSSSLGRGVHGAGPGEQGRSEEAVGRHNELDGAQMAAPGEGDVADAVAGRSRQGASGEQEDLAGDLERKKEEQAPLRESIQQSRADDVDVGGVLGQRGGPASTVD